jgi:hypothetical protein
MNGSNSVSENKDHAENTHALGSNPSSRRTGKARAICYIPGRDGIYVCMFCSECVRIIDVDTLQRSGLNCSFRLES